MQGLRQGQSGGFNIGCGKARRELLQQRPCDGVRIGGWIAVQALADLFQEEVS